MTGVAVDLDGVLCDTRPLWFDWLQAAQPILGLDAAELPADRAQAAAELDRRGAGNWRALLERWTEERAPVYVRRDAATSTALRWLAESGCAVGVWSDAPEPLARIVLAQLGANRRVAAVETGAGALERLLARMPPDSVLARTPDELSALAEAVSQGRGRVRPSA